MAAFYRETLGVPIVEERHGGSKPHYGCELGDVHFAIHPAADGSVPGTGAVKIAFLVFDLESLVAVLERNGVQLLYQPAKLGDGDSRITAVRDPDGNEVELTQLGDSWFHHLEHRRGEGHDVIAKWRTS